MAIIVIRDLPENVELDRQAMLAIAGGSRLRAHAGGLARAPLPTSRIVNFEPKQAATRQPPK